MKWIELTKKINDVLYVAVQSGYYNEENDFTHPCYCEIREWIGLEYSYDFVDPTGQKAPQFSGDDKVIDEYIAKVLLAMWDIVKTFGINQEI